jgi:hypothetical protein
MENAVDIGEMFPDEPVDGQVGGDGLIPTISHFIVHRGAFDAAIVHEGPSNVGDFGLKNEGDVLMKYCTGVGPTLWQTG